MPSFSDFLRLCWSIGWRSFGGPAAQIQLLHEEFVQKHALVSEEQFQTALGFCTLIPGPEAQQLATFLGHSLYGIRGALAAGLLFILPGSLCIGLWSAAYVIAPSHPATLTILSFLRPFALGLILAAIVRMFLRLPRTASALIWAFLSWGLLAMHVLPFPWILLLAGGSGALLQKASPKRPIPQKIASKLTSSLRIGSVSLIIWMLPFAACVGWLGRDHRLSQISILLSKSALTTFGGAYATLPYLASLAVDQYHWFSHLNMLDGLALGETTPGPLLLVLQFYGFLAAWNTPDPFTPSIAAGLGSLLALWATFAPSFFWILMGAPWATVLIQSPKIEAALRTISFAVVGSLASLGSSLSILEIKRHPSFPWLSAFLILAVVLWRLWKVVPSLFARRKPNPHQ